MRSLVPRLAQVFLALAALCLGAVLIIPWRNEPRLSPPPGTRSVLPLDAGQAGHSPEPASPETILSLFVKRSNSIPARTAPAPETRKPVDAPWLVFLGFYSGPSARPAYMLKDTRSGRVILASGDVSANGWSVIEIQEKRLVVRNGMDCYIVQKR